MAKNKSDKIENGAKNVAKSEMKGDIKAFAKNLKIQMLMGTLLFVMGLVILLAFAQPIFQENGINWTKLSILLMLCIYGMIVGRMEGIEWSFKREHGLYRFAIRKFDEAYSNIKDIINFLPQYCDFLYERKRKKKILKILSNYGINDERVLDLDITELHELVGKTYKKDWRGDKVYKPSRFAEKYKNGDCGEPYISYFNSYNEEQVEIIKNCIEGYFDVPRLSESYFMHPDSTRTQDAYFGASSSQSQKNKLTIWLMASRIITLILSCILLSSIGFEVYKSVEGNEGIAVLVQRLMDTFSRLFVLFTAIVWGFGIGVETVKIDTYYVGFRVDTLTNFRLEYDKGIFVPKDEETILKEKFEKEEKAREEAIKNVIIPEVVDTSKQIEFKPPQIN